MKKQNQKDSILFLNTPITDYDQDVIGVDTYVEKLNDAIDAGAQMIAVTSPFGFGKTSVIELLGKKRIIERDDKIVKISMWSQLDKDNNIGSTTDLHRSFIYQISSQIKHTQGTYISRRLSPNYGILKMHVNRKRYWGLFLVSFALILLSWGLSTFAENLIQIIPFLKDWAETLTTGFFLVGILFFVILIGTAEIIFSASSKTEVKREIETLEIIDLYRSEILKHYYRVIDDLHLIKRKRYIIIIEDLDRTTDADAVINFLKELRKYYVPQGTKYRNKVVFIVNIMPESILTSKIKMNDVSATQLATDDESLYAKLFDYSLNLQTINIDNYDVILEGLLKEKKESISTLGLNFSGNLSDIPGVKWIIRERRLKIREIKERLNIAFSLYESLSSKFSPNSIAFEKCAVVAYLTTAFEEDFLNTDHRAFEILIEQSIRKKLSLESCFEILPNTSDDYKKVVKELITAKLIDSNYRTYFYNFPRGGYLYSYDEMQIENAILYDEDIESLDQIAQKIVSDPSSLVINQAFQTLDQLLLPLPNTVFKSEVLYIEALKYSKKKVLQYFNNAVDYSNDSSAIAFFKDVLSYKKSLKFIDQEFAHELCIIWEKHFDESALLQLRIILCKDYSREITWFKNLFLGNHFIIKIDEMEYLKLIDAITLINYDNEDITIELVNYIFNRFLQQDSILEEEIKVVEKLLRDTSNHLKQQDIVPLYIDFMDATNRIVPDFEKHIYDLIDKSNDSVSDKLFNNYQRIINKTSDFLSPETLKYISYMARYSGYTLDVAAKLKENKYYIDYVLILLELGAYIPFEQEEIIEEIRKFKVYLRDKTDYFIPIRNRITQQPENVLFKYSFMFEADCPFITSQELHNIQNDLIVVQLIDPKIVKKDDCKTLSDFFNRKKHSNNLSFKILLFISNFYTNVANYCFYSLNFDSVRYRYISSKKKQKIVEAFWGVLELGNPKEKIKFMKATKYIEATWNLELIDAMKDNNELIEPFFEAVNSSDKITKTTFETVCLFYNKLMSPMSPLVIQMFLEKKKYIEYVVSVTFGNSRFEMAEGELLNELWPIYIEIFSSSNYPEIRKYMTSNHDFVRRIMAEKSYKGFAEENRMQLCGVYQDKDSIEDIMEYGEEFALKYYSSMAGFADESAATAFVNIVRNCPMLIASDELYNHTYEKLVSGSLKSLYTRVRNKGSN